ncbi:hypothetical protein [Kitasatospora sp. NRRL B-11411]|uniref:hypothetical protein n=1 Tax=Kitasatospora sp. NRRL B-11411 TaxID=1463822 RepID=UPI0004C408D2|nr:hypothetical protein [Kitasatospora sp. NRRL B-11411]
MTLDALDPGPDGTYPYFPRDAEGRPVWSDDPTGLPPTNAGAPMLRGVQHMRAPDHPGRWLAIDLTPRHPDGQPINPPVLPPDGTG